MDLAPKMWSLREWDQLIASGVLGEDSRVLLLEGEVLEMTPQNWAHSTSVGLVQDELTAALAPGTHLRVQMPLYLGASSDPEPDLAVVSGARRDYREQPTAALLVVEVADTSLAFDCGRKAKVYARFGIPEYWVVDLNGRSVHRFTEPNELGYGLTEVKGAEDELAWEDKSIQVSSLLP
jgi:Uma2 family endonuclease